MLKKSSVKTQTKPGDFVSKVYLYSGVAILISALFHMIGNFHKADSIVHLWLPVMTGGTVLVFAGLITKIITKIQQTGSKNKN